jgi:phosphoglycerate dehydrogenase-like enzyme
MAALSQAPAVRASEAHRQGYPREPEDTGMDNAREPPAGRGDRVLVTGGTGTLGRLVVPRLREAGCPLRVLSRHPREPTEGIEPVAGDLATGEGIDAGVAGSGVIVHCGGSLKGYVD